MKCNFVSSGKSDGIRHWFNEEYAGGVDVLTLCGVRARLGVPYPRDGTICATCSRIKDSHYDYPHDVAPSCKCKRCSMCSLPASHKVGEELSPTEARHNFTAYVCCHCFERIMGPVAGRACKAGL